MQVKRKPYATFTLCYGSHGSQKRSSPWGFYSFLSSYSSSVKSRYVFSRSVKISVTGALRSVTDDSTFPPGLPRSAGTSHVSLRSDQVLLRLSSSVMVFYDETWKMVCV